MIKITIIAVGNVRKKYFRDGLNEYLKRLSADAKISIEEIKAEPFFDNSDHNKIKKIEGDRINKSLKKHSQGKIVILDERGREFESREFSKFMYDNVRENVVFVIGGTLGLSRDILDYSGAVKMSLSKMTFPHEMVRLVLAEQIYRAIAIGKNKKYHY